MKQYSLLATFEIEGKQQFFETQLAPDFKALTPHIAGIESNLKSQGVEKIEFFVKEYEIKELGTHPIINGEVEEVSSEDE